MRPPLVFSGVYLIVIGGLVTLALTLAGVKGAGVEVAPWSYVVLIVGVLLAILGTWTR